MNHNPLCEKCGELMGRVSIIKNGIDSLTDLYLCENCMILYKAKTTVKLEEVKKDD